MRTIAKEELPNFRYPKKEVLPGPSEVKIGNMKLERTIHNIKKEEPYKE